MRIETANARTWLAAAVAGWALLVWGLALAGLGGRIGAIDPDGETAAPVAAAMPVPGTQPPLSRYSEIATRPLFSGDRRPHPFFIDPNDAGEGASAGFDYVLTSVLRTPDFAMAILQPAGGGDSIRLRVGEAPPEASNWALDSVDTRSAVFVGPDGPRTLELRVYDGVGGQPPTPMRAPVAGTDDPVQAQSGGTGRNRAPPPPPPSMPRVAPPTRAGSAAAATTEPPSAQAAPAAAESAPPASEAAGPSEAQVEAIRRRIEERRARLQQERATGGAPR